LILNGLIVVAMEPKWISSVQGESELTIG